MSTVSVDEIARDLAGWLRRVEAGEAMRIVRNGRPLADVSPARPPRRFGSLAGQFVVPDDFDAPMTEEELKLWYGE